MLSSRKYCLVIAMLSFAMAWQSLRFGFAVASQKLINHKRDVIMNKTLIVAGTLALALALGACGKKDDTSSSAAASDAAASASTAASDAGSAASSASSTASDAAASAADAASSASAASDTAASAAVAASGASQ